MKKAISVILVFIFVLSLSGCKTEKSNELSSLISSTQEKNESSESYVGVMSIKINPEFKLYFDSNGNVVSLEAVNSDAKLVLDKISSEETSFEKTIELIITVSSQLGFIKDGATVTFEMLDIIDKNIDVNEMLKKASDVSQKTATQLKINIEVGQKTADNDKTPESKKSTAEDSSSNITNNNANGTAKHTHSFSPATCTEPEKCVCGKTRGTALGHKWQDATCSSPKTCTVCKKTEGEKMSHNFVNGVCAVCGKDNFESPQKIEYEKEYIGNLRFEFGELTGSGISFFDDGEFYCLLLSPVYSDKKEDEYQTVVEYNGKKYYHVGAGMMPYKYSIVSNSFVVYGSNGAELITLKLLRDNTLIVIKSADGRFPINTILK